MSIESGRKISRRVPTIEPMETVCERVIENVDKRTGKPEIETGIDILDGACMGLHPSHLTTIAARPGQGKTTLACQIALKLAERDVETTFVSLEMTKESLVEKMFACYAKIPLAELTRGNSELMMKDFPNFMRLVSGVGKMTIIDDYAHTEDELYTLIEHLNFKPTVLILDHLQQVRYSDGDGRRSSWEVLTQYLSYLKCVAMRYKICVICLSQINRGGEEHPTLANLKGTGGIEELSDQVLLCFKKKEEDTLGSNYTIDLAKNRFGTVGVFDLYHRLGEARFYNCRTDYEPYYKRSVDLYGKRKYDDREKERKDLQ